MKTILITIVVILVVQCVIITKMANENRLQGEFNKKVMRILLKDMKYDVDLEFYRNGK